MCFYVFLDLFFVLSEMLDSEFQKVNEGVIEIESMTEEQDMVANKQYHQHQLQTYKDRKSRELEQAKGAHIQLP